MKEEIKSWGISSLVCGILSLLLVIAPYFGLPLGILALVFAYKQRKIEPDGFSVSGIVLGIIGICINAVMLIILGFSLLLASTF